jgi:uncharacterized protein Yka (UPF0111/DUF47 family)
VDKPLSQERLKPEQLEEIERQEYMNSISGRNDLKYPIGPEVLKLVNEVKRLQAIESSSFDMYKTALEVIAESEDEWYIGRISHRQYARNILNIGDEPHEA